MSEPTVSDRLTFVAHQRPALPAGDYSITAKQRVSLESDPYTVNRTFTVGGERFALPPTEIRAVFPPDGSLGDHTTVLPHVILERSSLPWERRPGGPDDIARPWLALLLFSDDEIPAPTTVTLGDLATGPAYIPAPRLETHDAATDQVSVIDVPRTLLADLIPGLADLAYLAHVRRSGGTGTDTAVVLGTRLPSAGASSTVHLVTVEGRYGPDGFDLGPDTPGALVRLVTLANWRFACVREDQTFAHLARALTDQGHPFRLPDSGEPAADAFLRQGYVPVRHNLRQGGRTISWYRGPFVTGPAPAPVPSALRTPDQLLRFYTDAGMFDTGYAAAWQLGRLIALQHTAAATALYGWKRRRAQEIKRPDPSGLPLIVPHIDTDLPPSVQALFDDLAHLRGVPLRYLVPDDRLLPVETVRFLQLDPAWVAALIDGAYSIGRITRLDAEEDRQQPPSVNLPQVTGALIRSDLVAGYPDLLVDGYADAAGTTQLTAIPARRLSETVLLCLFEGELTRLDLHQRPEALHFAVEPVTGGITKTLRTGATLPALLPGPRRTAPIATLAAAMATALTTAVDSAGFAVQMIETAERVSFLRTRPSR
jgi:hypothetical protein